ncbi:MAG: hypothetical protein M1150_01700 [Patescibacteria group bacterium]|nr:hypothetical protein [Patescibacteria group bacterium]
MKKAKGRRLFLEPGVEVVVRIGDVTVTMIIKGRNKEVYAVNVGGTSKKFPLEVIEKNVKLIRDKRKDSSWLVPIKQKGQVIDAELPKVCAS